MQVFNVKLSLLQEVGRSHADTGSAFPPRQQHAVNAAAAIDADSAADAADSAAAGNAVIEEQPRPKPRARRKGSGRRRRSKKSSVGDDEDLDGGGGDSSNPFLDQMRQSSGGMDVKGQQRRGSGHLLCSLVCFSHFRTKNQQQHRSRVQARQDE